MQGVTGRDAWTIKNETSHMDNLLENIDLIFHFANLHITSLAQDLSVI